jgi:hypothetical protein
MRALGQTPFLTQSGASRLRIAATQTEPLPPFRWPQFPDLIIEGLHGGAGVLSRLRDQSSFPEGLSPLRACARVPRHRRRRSVIPSLPGPGRACSRAWRRHRDHPLSERHSRLRRADSWPSKRQGQRRCEGRRDGKGAALFCPATERPARCPLKRHTGVGPVPRRWLNRNGVCCGALSRLWHIEMKWYRDVRNGFEFDSFRSQTCRDTRPSRWATHHNIRHCDF